ncbi:MAG: 4'-phosphopantetheinyl transferase superfamily protein [Treponema sp.]|nr:4'-phosphopantetheinyl transferase superfamily protein [Treponema sp.]
MSNNTGSHDGISGIPEGIHRRQTDEGRRILALLDRKAAFCPENKTIKDEGAAEKTGVLAYETGGRPFFTDTHADFNISHSGRMVAVAYVGKAEGTASILRTGCDVQAVDTHRNRDEIVKRFFHDEEGRYVEAALDPPERNLRFFRLWVLKEAYLKMKGFSIGEIAKTPVFFPDGETPGFRAAEDGTDRETALSFYLSEWGELPDAYTLAVCLAGNGVAADPPETLWLSRKHLSGGLWLSVPPVFRVYPLRVSRSSGRSSK